MKTFNRIPIGYSNMKHLLENDPFFWNFKLYLRADSYNKLRMQKALIDWCIEEQDLFDTKYNLDEKLIDIMTYDLHLTWEPSEEYEICALYTDAIKNCRDILIGKL